MASIVRGSVAMSPRLLKPPPSHTTTASSREIHTPGPFADPPSILRVKKSLLERTYSVATASLTPPTLASAPPPSTLTYAPPERSSQASMPANGGSGSSSSRRKRKRGELDTGSRDRAHAQAARKRGRQTGRSQYAK